MFLLDIEKGANIPDTYHLSVHVPKKLKNTDHQVCQTPHYMKRNNILHIYLCLSKTAR